ncbi:MAG: MBOAT family O-acyltransferase, partial [Candidatus Delongbacteria bacterium]
MTIILPLGISFYIFLSLSYVIDIFTKKEKVNRNIVEVLLSLSFFPIILAGPIHRPASLIKQFQAKRVFRYHQIVMGLRKILWGLFMKIVIADNCAVFTADIFERFDQYNGSTLLLGGILYTIQIYADFAGYSEIAIGTSNLLGFEIIRNFNYPYFAKDITDFWKRWHISLTLWFRDYVFLPFTFLISRKLPAQKTFHINTDYIIYASGIALTWTL